MALINCPECKKEISDMAESCPNCGFPIAKKAALKPALPAMLWDSEEEGYICIKCPQCNKESRIKETAATKTSTGYKLAGEGKCTCGLHIFQRSHLGLVMWEQCYGQVLRLTKYGR